MSLRTDTPPLVPRWRVRLVTWAEGTSEDEPHSQSQSAASNLGTYLSNNMNLLFLGPKYIGASL